MSRTELERDLRVPEATQARADLTIVTANHRQNIAGTIVFFKAFSRFYFGGTLRDRRHQRNGQCWNAGRNDHELRFGVGESFKKLEQFPLPGT